MVGILDALSSVLPIKYKTMLNYIPSVAPDIPVGDVLVITLIKETSLRSLKLGNTSPYGYEADLSFYIRKEPVGDFFNEVRNDLSSYHATIAGYLNKQIADKRIRKITDRDIIPIGRDEQGNFEMSCSFKVTYYDN